MVVCITAPAEGLDMMQESLYVSLTLNHDCFTPLEMLSSKLFVWE